jgi:hypothetical protein
VSVILCQHAHEIYAILACGFASDEIVEGVINALSRNMVCSSVSASALRVDIESTGRKVKAFRNPLRQSMGPPDGAEFATANNPYLQATLQVAIRATHRHFFRD